MSVLDLGPVMHKRRVAEIKRRKFLSGDGSVDLTDMIGDAPIGSPRYVEIVDAARDAIAPTSNGGDAA